MRKFPGGKLTEPASDRGRGSEDCSRNRTRRRNRLPCIECLEPRITLSTDIWTGDAGTKWMVAANWSNDTIPQVGDDLSFGAGAIDFGPVNDFPSGTSFNSITIGTSGYNLSGNPVDLAGGITASYSSGTSTDSMDTDLGAGTVSVSAGGELALNGAIAGTSGLSVSGGGTVALGGSASGTTTLSGLGTTLLVDGTAGAVQVNAGSVLGGTGTTGAVNSTGGTISPGDSPAVLTTGSLTLDSNSTFIAELDGSDDGNGTTEYDQVVAGGAVSLDGATLNLSIGGGYTPAVGDQLTIIKNNSGSDITGTFAGLAEGAEVTVSGFAFGITYKGGGSQQDVVLTALAASTIDVSASVPTSTYGDSVTFTAQVSGGVGIPTGSVDFFDGDPTGGGIELGSDGLDAQGFATYSTSTLHVAGSPYSIFAVYNPDASSNYASSTTTTPASLTVDPASLTITANDASNVYGDPLPTFTFSYSGFQNGDTDSSLTTGPTIATSATQVSPVTPDGYVITPQGAVDPDYTISYVPGTLTITQATLTAALKGTVVKTYDGTTDAALLPGNYQLSGVLNGDDVSLSDPATGSYDNKDVGTGKSVSVTGLSISGANAGNYALSSASVSGNVGQIQTLALTVTGVIGDNKVYDGNTTATINTSSAVLAGVISGDDVNLDTAGSAASLADQNVGTAKPVTVVGLSLVGADAGDYTLIQPTATANITPAALAVTADAETMTYGGTVPTLTYVATGLVGMDTVSSVLSGSLATTGSSSSPVGTYPITQGTLASNGNYTIGFTGANLSVTPAPLTITPNSVSVNFGAAIPAFTATYTGFVNGDTPASLTTLPSLTTSATSTSPAGMYEIIASGASSNNYAITYVPGTLVITLASTTAALSSSVGILVVGQAATFTVQVTPVSPGVGNPTGSVTFFLDGTPIGTASVDAATGQASFLTSSIGLGPHTATAVYSGDPNFQPSQSKSNMLFTTTALSQSIVTALAVRNGRGRIVSVNLQSQVLAVSPASGVPTGTVTYFANGRKFKTKGLSNGTAVVSLKPNQVLKKAFTIRYSGDANFKTSASSKLVVTNRVLSMSARPLTAFFARGHTPRRCDVSSRPNWRRG